MNNLDQLIAEKRLALEKNKNEKPKRFNILWEQAVEFCKYCGFSVDKGMVVFVLKLCKVYGAGKVFGLKSWIKDYNYDKNRLQGLLVWKLKHDAQI